MVPVPPAPPLDGFTQPNGLPAVPLVLGLVGHDDVRALDEADLREQLAQIFLQFQQAYPYTPLVLLASLAEGADQLAAQVALDNQVFVRAALPFEPAVFRQSTLLRTQTARATLDDLLDHPHVEPFVVPLPKELEEEVTDQTTWEAVAADPVDPVHWAFRQLCCANVGGYIVRHCHALIALWNGNEGQPDQPAGPAEFVTFKLEGKAPALYPWTDSHPLGFRGERGLVCVLYTPHGEATAADQFAGTRDVRVPARRHPDEVSDANRDWVSVGRHEWLRAIPAWIHFLRRGRRSFWPFTVKAGPKEELWQFRETCQAVDHFNRDVVRTPDVDGLRKRLARVRADIPADLQPTDRHARWLTRFSAVREAAAHLARELQPEVDRLQLVVFLLLGFSVAFFHAYAHLDEPTHNPLFLGLFVVLLAAAGLTVAHVWYWRLHERRLDYRALAEALRVRRAWALAGLDESVADSYLGQLRGELSWARRALLDVCPPPREWGRPFDALDAAERRERLRERVQKVSREWVSEQVGQFKKSHRREHAQAARLRLAGLLLAVVGWLWLPAAVYIRYQLPPNQPVVEKEARADPEEGHAPAGGHHAPPPTQPSVLAIAERPAQEWLLVSGLLVIVGGLCIAYCERRSYEELAKQYERMHVVFENGKHELERRLAADDVEGAQTVLKALGHEAIAEHAQWLILRRSRPVELHVGG